MGSTVPEGFVRPVMNATGENLEKVGADDSSRVDNGCNGNMHKAEKCERMVPTHLSPCTRLGLLYQTEAKEITNKS